MIRLGYVLGSRVLSRFASRVVGVVSLILPLALLSLLPFPLSFQCVALAGGVCTLAVALTVLGLRLSGVKRSIWLCGRGCDALGFGKEASLNITE
jgi:hypothetical protein